MHSNRAVIFGLVLLLIPVFAFANGTPESDDETIHIALSAPITGDWSEFGVNFQRSVELAIEALNAEGGILGRPVRLSAGDTRGNPQEAATLAQRWTSDPTVVAQIGSFSSSSSMAAQPIFDAAGMVQLSPTASHTDYARGSQWSFGIVGTQAGEGPLRMKTSVFVPSRYYTSITTGVSTPPNFSARRSRNSAARLPVSNSTSTAKATSPLL